MATIDTSFGIIPVLQSSPSPQFLLVQHNRGHWGFPKGHPEPGESALQSACREFEEETGIQHYRVISEQTFTEDYVHTQADRVITKTVTYFLAQVETATVTLQAEEIQAYAWLPLAAALERLSYETTRQLLMEVSQLL